MSLTKEKTTMAFSTLKDSFGYTNVMQAPRILKVVVSVGTGKVKDKQQIGLIQDRLARMTGQKAAARGAKKSIATFKVREGDVVGYQVTLRGAPMYAFLDKLIHIVFPRTRDFRGIEISSVDAMGNITIGIKEHTIFPEASDEELKNVFGLAVTIVTSVRGKEEAEAFLRHIGMPLKARMEQ
jgi:large subunit ribosomal protein L5